MSITLTNVTKCFDSLCTLSDFSFNFTSGGRYCLLGPSGAGKTTLLRIIAGLTPLDGGHVDAEGNISYLFQEDRLLAWYTAKQNVALVSNGELAEELLRALGLGDFLHALPDELSGGMRRRVAIARTLAVKSDIYLFDEPLKELDESTQSQVAALINHYTKGATCLFVSHRPGDAELFCAETIQFSAMPLTVQ